MDQESHASGSDDEDILFGQSVFQSLDATLDEISHQMKRGSDIDGKDTMDAEDYNSDDDVPAVQKDKYDNQEVDDDGSSEYSSSEYEDTDDEMSDEDPESGEMELYSMMDSLVAELQMEMDRLEDGSAAPVSGVPAATTAPVAAAAASSPMDSKDNEAADDIVPVSDYTDYVPVSDFTKNNSASTPPRQPVTATTTTTTPTSSSPSSKLKSLWRMLADYAPSRDEGDGDGDGDDGKAEEIPAAEEVSASPAGNAITSTPDRQGAGGTGVNGERQDTDVASSESPFLNMTTPTKDDPDYVPVMDYTDTGGSTTSSSSPNHHLAMPKNPTKQDIEKLIGTLSEFKNRRTTPVKKPSNSQDIDEDVPNLDEDDEDKEYETVESAKPNDPDYVPVSDYSSPSKEKEDNVNGDKKEIQKAGHAMSNFAAKKPKEYLLRKKQEGQDGRGGEDAASEEEQEEEDTIEPQSGLPPQTTTNSNNGNNTSSRRKKSNRNRRQRSSTTAANGDNNNVGNTTSTAPKKHQKVRRTNKKLKKKRQQRKNFEQQLEQLRQAVANGSNGDDEQYPEDGAPPNDGYHDSGNNGGSFYSSDQAIRALAKSELWRMIVDQAFRGVG